MTTVLLTGFKAFGDTPVNPANPVGRLIERRNHDHRNMHGHLIGHLSIPIEFPAKVPK